MTTQATKFRLWYNRWAPLIMTVCMIIGATAAVIGVVGIQRTSATQAEQARLLECFDRYAAVSSTSSKAVRDASQAKDAATTTLNAALADEGDAFLTLTTLLGRSLAGVHVEPDRFASVVHRLESTLQARQAANVTVIDAQTALDQARADNPVPDPPSEFCGSDADKEGPTQ